MNIANKFPYESVLTAIQNAMDLVEEFGSSAQVAVSAKLFNRTGWAYDIDWADHPYLLKATQQEQYCDILRTIHEVLEKEQGNEYRDKLVALLRGLEWKEPEKAADLDGARELEAIGQLIVANARCWQEMDKIHRHPNPPYEPPQLKSQAEKEADLHMSLHNLQKYWQTAASTFPPVQPEKGFFRRCLGRWID